jgi:hypothetical protein
MPQMAVHVKLEARWWMDQNVFVCLECTKQTNHVLFAQSDHFVSTVS